MDYLNTLDGTLIPVDKILEIPKEMARIAPLLSYEMESDRKTFSVCKHGGCHLYTDMTLYDDRQSKWAKYSELKICAKVKVCIDDICINAKKCSCMIVFFFKSFHVIAHLSWECWFLSL